jgi:hypothetical protein
VILKNYIATNESKVEMKDYKILTSLLMSAVLVSTTSVSQRTSGEDASVMALSVLIKAD